MEEYNSYRWERLEYLGLDFLYVKHIVKSNYNYEIRERDLINFIANISTYKDINEVELLNILEEHVYKKVFVFSIRQYKKNKEMPFIEEITNNILNVLFKERNDIKIENDEYFDGELDSCFRVIYYKNDDEFSIIKMSRIISVDTSNNLDDGTIEEDTIILYDCCKFIIDLNNKLVFMFFNDLNNSDGNISKEITYKKAAFRELFLNVSNRNILKYSFIQYLENYFQEYINDIKQGNQRKLVSIIEASSIDTKEEEKSLIRSVKRNYVHNRKRLDAIENDIKNEGLTISEIECCINGTIVDLRHEGEICCINNFLNEEVIKSVCKEFFNEYKLS
ncbi:hypothetical protein DVW08_08865 [Clostridium botulinum]|nr:hypothetical protein [Clostridium botulinum]